MEVFTVMNTLIVFSSHFRKFWYSLGKVHTSENFGIHWERYKLLSSMNHF